MQEVKDIPKKGQFVLVWSYDDKIWSKTYKIEDRVIYLYDDVEDEWIYDHNFVDHYSVMKNIKIFAM